MPHILLTMDPAWLWLAGILGLYLYDALLVLADNEWLLLYSGQRWQAVWPSDRWRWCGQRLWLPLPWRPDIPALRTSWPIQGYTNSQATDIIQNTHPYTFLCNIEKAINNIYPQLHNTSSTTQHTTAFAQPVQKVPHATSDISHTSTIQIRHDKNTLYTATRIKFQAKNKGYLTTSHTNSRVHLATSTQANTAAAILYSPHPHGQSALAHTTADVAVIAHALCTRLHALRHLRWCIWPLGLTLLMLPLVLKYAPQRDMWLLLCLALIYSCVLALAILMLRHWQALGISRSTVGKLALEYLLCPPFAVNAIRHLALMQTVPGDALELAHHVLSRNDWIALHQQLHTEVHTRLALLPEGDSASHHLYLWWQNFVQRYPAPQDKDESNYY